MFSFVRIVLLIMISTTALADIFGVSALESTQWINKGYLSAITETNKAQLDQISSLLDDASKNSALLNEYHWSNIQQQLDKLAEIVQKNQALAYSAMDIDELFSQRYPGYQDAKKYKADYQAWSNTTMDTIRGSLLSANLQSAQFATEEDTLRELRRLSQTRTGRLQAIQIGHQIAIEQIAQTQKLRQLIMSQMSGQDAYMASQEQKDARRRASVDEIFPKKKAGADHDYHGF